MLRWLHRHRLSRHRIRGTWLHSRIGDRLLDKALWKPTRESLARAWLVGFPITVVPFLPMQALIACITALLTRGNLLLCITLQLLSSPLTAPVHLPACYFVGEVARGHSPSVVWRQIVSAPSGVFTGDSLASLYLGAAVVGIAGGLLGYVLLKNFWSIPLKRKRHSPPA